MESPDKLIQLLESYDYANIVQHGDNYISFGRDETSRKDAICIWLKENSYLNVKDFSANSYEDIISYLMKNRKQDFKDVLNGMKAVLGVSDVFYQPTRRLPFGGIYQNINRKKNVKPTVYPESELDGYELTANTRFIKDHIDIATQLKFGLRYDDNSQSILIPIRDPEGNLMGVKCRKNYEDDEMKYWYMIPCRASQTLYGFSQNYKYLTNGTIYLFEAEKSVMQAVSYGVNNALALGSGSVSDDQVRLLYGLQPKKIYLLHDYGYDEESVMKNVNKIKNYSGMMKPEVYIWKNFERVYDNKYSPTDLGLGEFNRILNEEVSLSN